MIKRALYMVVALCLCLSCNKSKEQEQEQEYIPETTPQTTLMYMTGTDLSYYYGQNITAIRTAVAEDALGYSRFLVFRHSTSSTATLVEYKFEDGACVTETLKSYDDIISLTQDGFTEVVADLKEFAPADSYNLIISGHATGWVPKERLSSSWSVASPMPVIDWEAMNNSEIVTRYLGSKNDSYFDIDELQEALDATQTHFGYILFDECFMSSIEALYTLRNNCDYIIASPCEIMGNGFPYDTVLPHLFSNKGIETDLQATCQAYYDYYCDYSIPSGCVALTVTAELDALADITRQINQSYNDDGLDVDSLQSYERLEEGVFFDFEEYMLAKCGDSTLSDTLYAQMQKAFPEDCRLHTERFFANIGVSASSANNYEEYFTTINYYSGVTTSAPSSQMSSEWAKTEWAIDVN